jgi:hypothetical protein
MTVLFLLFLVVPALQRALVPQPRAIRIDSRDRRIDRR